MSEFWSDVVHRTDPYTPGEQPHANHIIKLNTNENPYPPSKKVLEALRKTANEDLRLYPSPTADELRETVANIYSVSPDQVFVGNGSDEVLAFSFYAFFNCVERIKFPDISYSFYPVYAQLYNLKYDLVSLKEDFSIPIEAFYQAAGGVILPNPNAPTGKYLDLGSIEKIVRNNSNKVVIIDEAYIDFGGESAVSLINSYDNLLVIQTLSKSRSLAGLRVGFAFGQSHLIEGLNRIKNSFNSYPLDRFALAGAKAALEDSDYFEETRLKIIATRERVADELRRLNFSVLESKANFLFVKHLTVHAKVIFEKLKEKGIYVRYFNQSRIEEYLRITIGNDEEMDIFIEKLKDIINANI